MLTDSAYETLFQNTNVLGSKYVLFKKIYSLANNLRYYRETTFLVMLYFITKHTHIKPKKQSTTCHQSKEVVITQTISDMWLQANFLITQFIFCSPFISVYSNFYSLFNHTLDCFPVFYCFTHISLRREILFRSSSIALFPLL